MYLNLIRRIVRMFAVDVCLIDSSASQKLWLGNASPDRPTISPNAKLFHVDHSYEIAGNFAAARISRRLITLDHCSVIVFAIVPPLIGLNYLAVCTVIAVNLRPVLFVPCSYERALFGLIYSPRFCPPRALSKYMFEVCYAEYLASMWLLVPFVADC